MWDFIKLKFQDEENGGEGGDGGAAPVIVTGESGGEAPVAPVGEGGEPPAAPSANEGGVEPPASESDADWAPDWRLKISTDEKHQKTLERFASPKAMYESYMALRQKVDSGELKAPGQPFPEEGTDEEKAAWRQENNVPEKPEDYTLNLGDGLVIGENDKPIADDFMKYAHDKNMSQETVNAALGWYYDFNTRQEEQREQADSQYLEQTEDQLRTEWGNDYRTNLNLIKGMVDTLPEDVRDLFVNARLADGNALMNNPSMVRWMVEQARTINPVATVVPGAGANMASAIDDEIKQIEGVMLNDRKSYNSDEGMQKRLRDLYAARERAGS